MTERRDQPPSLHGGLHDNPELWLPRLRRILDDQIGLYSRLTELAGQQSHVIQSGDTDALLSLLGQRQTLVERVIALNEDLEPFTSRWDELSPKLPETRRAEVRDRIDTLESLVARIAARDEQDHAALKQQRDAVTSELGGISQRRSAVNAYATGSSQPHIPRYQDREG